MKSLESIDALGEHEWMSMTSAARWLRTDPKRFSKMVETGLVVPFTRDPDSGRPKFTKAHLMATQRRAGEVVAEREAS